MARTAKNKLTIRAENDGSFYLFGFVLGKKIRRFSKDLAGLQALKAELEQSALANKADEMDRQAPRLTRLTTEQLRDAEAAFQILAGSSHGLLQCVEAARRVLGDGGVKDAEEALKAWQEDQKRLFRSPRTIAGNSARITSFLKSCSAKTVNEISPSDVEAYVFPREGGLEPNSHLSRARPVKAWLNFCVEKKWIRHNPCEIKVGELAESVSRQRTEEDRILTPAQCEALFRAAAEYRGGVLLPYVVLCLWCFIRSKDVQLLTPEKIYLKNKVPVVKVMARKRGTKDYLVTIPQNMVPVLQYCLDTGLLKAGERVPFSRFGFDEIRERAGLITRAEVLDHEQRPEILESDWKDNILRHTGESYFYQKTGDIKETTRQAGHSETTAWRHYLDLPAEGIHEAFYGISLADIMPVALTA